MLTVGMDPRGALQEEQKQFHPALLSSSNRFEAASLQGSCGDRRRGVFPKCLLGRRSTDLEKPAEREPAGPLNSCSGPGSSAASLQQRPPGSTRGGRGPTPPPQLRDLGDRPPAPPVVPRPLGKPRPPLAGRGVAQSPHSTLSPPALASAAAQQALFCTIGD